MKHVLVKCIRKILSFLFYFFSIKKNKIVLINFNGKGFGCNPKYIAQELLKQSTEFDLVWLVNDIHEKFPEKRIRRVTYGRIKSLYEIATAKVIITNVKNDLYLLKKRGQYIIQTWHGSYGPKPAENEVRDKLSPTYIKESEKNSKQTDLFLSNSKALSEYYKEAFWCECEIMECGFPRNDIFFSDELSDQIKRIKSNLGISNVTKIVLYAPTFRDDGRLDVYKIDCNRIINALNKEHLNWKILIRLHPNVTDYENIFDWSENVIDLSTYPDMQELLLISDILITDYSSVIFDFAVMRKPSYIYAPDIDEYKKNRGIRSWFFSMPYSICTTNDELIELLNQYDSDKGKIQAEQFLSLYGGVDKGNASKKVVERIRRVMNI